MDRELAGLIQRVLDQSNAFVYVLDPELRYLFLNRIALDIGYGGRSLDQVVGKRGRDFWPDADGDLDLLEVHDRYVLEKGQPVQVYEVLMGKVMYAQKWPIFNDWGQVCGVAGVSFDVTSVVKERVSGEGDDAALMVNMMDSTSRMISAMLKMTAALNRP